jgi:nucleotide-binding universal stress UspA family protein
MTSSQAGTGFSRILAAIDETPPSSAAVDLAIGLARRFGSELAICTAIDAQVIADLNEIVRDQARALLEDASAKARAAGVRVETEEIAGTASTVADFAREKGADLIVLGTHGRHGIARMVLGSTAAGVIAATRIPALVTKAPLAEGAATRPFAHVLVAVDDSDPSDAAVAAAIDLAARDRARVTFCSVVESNALAIRAVEIGYDPNDAIAEGRAHAQGLVDAALAAARARGVEARGEIAAGNPAQALLDVARAENADLVVVGSHGRRGLQRLFVGSVAEGVARDSDVPVLVVRAKA